MLPAIEAYPQTIAVLKAMSSNHWSITAREAMMDLDMTSATLARRVCDLEEAGIRIHRERKVNPVTGKKYTRYWASPDQIQQIGVTPDMFEKSAA